MKHRTLALVAATALLVVIGAVTLALTLPPVEESVGNPGTAAKTTFPGLATPTGEPPVPGLMELHPAAGTVGRAPGPFDDRFVWERLQLDQNGVHGVARVTSDVSEILEFSAVAGFYDAEGKLLDTARWNYHRVEETEHGSPDESLRFTIRVPENLRSRAVAAAVGVPVLVNE